MKALGEVLLNFSRIEEKAEEALYGGKGETSVAVGPSSSAKGLFVLSLWKFAKITVLLTAHQGEAERLLGDITSFLFPSEKAPDPFKSPICLYLPDEPPLDPDSTADLKTVHERLYALHRLLRGEPTIIVTTATALLTPTISPEALSEAVLEVRRGEWIAREGLVEGLLRLGYERADLVEAGGQFAVRGGVVDLFPANSLRPVRVEFFGDEVESVREFDLESQRSVREFDSLTILPAREMVFLKEAFERAAERLEREAGERAQALRTEGKGKEAARLMEWALEDVEALRRASPFPTLERYKPLIFGGAATLADYLPDTALFALDEPVRMKAHLEEFERDLQGWAKTALERGETLPSIVPPERVWARVAKIVKGRRYLLLTSLAEDLPEIPAERRVESGTTSPRGFGGTLEGSLGAMEALAKRERHAVVCVTQAAERVKEALAERAKVPVTDEIGPHHGAIWVVKGVLSNGFSFPEARLTVITDSELFGARRIKRMRARRRVGLPLESLSDLKPGDYLVHIHHGIGIYKGLCKQVVDGAEREYLLIQYAGEDRLYLPVHELHRVQKYIALEEEPPPLSSLGGRGWLQTAARARKAAFELARELLQLYAKRAKAEGFAFSPDQPWQLELETSFPFEETEDQLRAVEEVKRDMERPKPMDRLVCGDVGFGKTEVAVRAAFKAALDGKQVAVLVPTTVLAEQHFRTFRERVAPFPMRVEMLSRFVSPKRQREILQGLKAGTVDVVIGTHRLFSEDVQFKDLGLVIIDEEHRFGVRQKEKLKQLKPEVDLLTLTATPIPRTLYMALSGILDLSVINQPPVGRKPVKMRICRYDPELVREAILRELERGGQVFYLHNRVETIEFVVQRVKELVPQAEVAFAHGQMPEEKLEQVMCDFVEGKIDVLVCTSIIGSGLDIPNANTLIVERADRDFGLSQLYHLKGRVGRSDRQAYAFFLLSRRGEMTPGAQLRLSALREFSELGSGLRLAMRDLEVRGAGNLLGPEQHGHIRAVGLSLYMQLLEEAMREAKGEKVRPKRLQPTMDIAVDARLPESYIEEEGLRIEVYRRLAACDTEEELEGMREELRDRFGPLPKEAEKLLRVLRLRIRASLCGISSLRTGGGKLVVSLSRPLRRTQSEAVVDRVLKMGRPAALLEFEPSPRQLIGRMPGGLGKEDLLAAAEQVVEAVFSVVGPVEERKVT